MNKVLNSIRNRISNNRYPVMSNLSVESVEDETASGGFREEVVHRTTVELNLNTIAPSSYRQSIEREHFEKIQQMLYGDIRCALSEVRFEARTSNNQRIINLVDEILTDIGYLR